MQQCVWVRVPSGAPRRSKLHIACSDFFQKSERTHFAAPPFQITTAALGCDLVLGANLKAAASILLRCYNKNATTLVVAFLLGFGPAERTEAPFDHGTAEMNDPGHLLLLLRGRRKAAFIVV